MCNVTDYLVDAQERFQSVDGLDAVFSVVEQLSDQIGMGKIAYGCFSGEVGLEGQSPAVRLNYGTDWIETYFTENFQAIDPVVQHIMQAGRLTHWDDLARTSKQRAFLRLAAGYGLKHGLSIPFVGPRGGAYVFSFAGLDRIDQVQVQSCLVLASLAHARLLDTVGLMTPPVDEYGLTDQQKAILAAIADGKTVNQVADDLGMTRDGVNYHLKAARRALDTVNLAHTVAVAIRYNLI